MARSANTKVFVYIFIAVCECDVPFHALWTVHTYDLNVAISATEKLEPLQGSALRERFEAGLRSRGPDRLGVEEVRPSARSPCHTRLTFNLQHKQ